MTSRSECPQCAAQHARTGSAGWPRTSHNHPSSQQTPASHLAKSEELRDGLGGPAELVAVEDGSHTAGLSHPDQVNAAMLGFLRSLG